ncbi:MAG: DUF4179 domain-containing protein [Oscillospiraceae bacterium]|nr:DUF4179 domain-containing protein [Oscillospiraceae bacterium]
MTKKEYRVAMDEIVFDMDFQKQTIDKLSSAAQQNRKELPQMNKKRIFKAFPLAAVLAVVLTVSAVAAVLLLNPSDVANEMQLPALAAAFESDSAVAINKTVESEGYDITLAGIVSGKDLSDSAFSQEVTDERTYAVVAVRNADGTPIEESISDFVVTPLVSGYAPRAVNAWTLGGGYSSFVKDGIAYYLFDYQSLEMFADHTVYLAAYQGSVPSSDDFTMDSNGAIDFTDSITGPHALFTLPMDESKADPAAVEQFFAESGIDKLLNPAD